MSDSALFSEHWFRFKELKPTLASDVQVTRHIYRQQVHYLLHRKSTSGYFRLDSHSYEIVGKLDGSISVENLWQLALAQHDEHAPTQNDVIQILAQLHDADLLVVNKKLNAEQLFSRGRKKQRTELRQRYLNPLFLRFRLVDPDHLLKTITPYLEFVFTQKAVVLWFLLLISTIASIVPNWHELKTEIISFDFLSPRYILLFFLIYPILKLLHEMAHGVAVRHYGGQVHEFGIALMVLLPIPYVDASAASLFTSKRKRITVSIAGIVVELSIAMIAYFIWLHSDGIIQDTALILMVIGGVTTVFINGNPLLRFDGYYALADYIEIPDLATKSNLYLRQLTAKYLNLKDEIDVFIADQKEQIWLTAYGLMAGLYRFLLMLSIAWILSSKYFFIGAALSAWIIFAMIILPTFKFLRYVSSHCSSASTGAVLKVSSSLALILAAVTLLPLPLSTVTDGVIWLPSNAIVRANHHCQIIEQNAQPGKIINAGDTLFFCEDPELDSLLKIGNAELQELRANRFSASFSDRIKQAVMEDKIATAESKLAKINEQIIDQQVRAQATGRFVIAEDTLLEGRFLKKGEIVAYIVPKSERSIHVAIKQSQIHKIDYESKHIEIRLLSDLLSGQTYPTSLTHRTHQASFDVTSATLTTAGGGSLPAHPQGNGRSLQNPVFNLELSWPENAPNPGIGSRVKVRFDHGSQPALYRMVTHLQRALIRGSRA